MEQLSVPGFSTSQVVSFTAEGASVSQTAESADKRMEGSGENRKKRIKKTERG